MLEIRLLRYYERLIPVGIQQDCCITLDDIADKLCTTKRHARNLINRMHMMHWICWKPSAGRGNRSKLFLQYDLRQLKEIVALECIEQGSYDKALSVLNKDQQWLVKLLKTTSGTSYNAGQLSLRFMYYRPFSALLPHVPQKNSERFLLRQIYCCLTQCDENGAIYGQLVHHWISKNNGKNWYFYLRPDLTFHNGEIIDALAISNLFSQLKYHPNYKIELEHLEKVSAIHPLCIEFLLSEVDLGFAGLLSDVKFAIQPHTQLNSEVRWPIVGSGFFQVKDHTENILTLSAFRDFYGCRALPEKISIWSVAGQAHENKELDISPSYIGKVQFKLDNDISNSADKKFTRLEFGCQYLLFNLNKFFRPLTAIQRRWLSTYLSPENIVKEEHVDTLVLGTKIAKNLLHTWKEINNKEEIKVILPDHLEIAVHEQNDLKIHAQTICNLLESQGVHCVVNYYSLIELHHRARANLLSEQIILSSVNLDDNRPISLFRWLYADPLFRASFVDAEYEWFYNELMVMRENKTVENYCSTMESIVFKMINESWIKPLFHHWQMMLFQDKIQGVSISNWGWPELKTIWVF